MNATLAEFEMYMDDGKVDAQNVPDDPFRKFLEDGALAASLGRNGHAHVARFNEEVADLDKRADEILRKARATAPAAGWDEEIISTSQPLAKMETAGDRRRANLRTWMKNEFALGKSARELIEYAARHDQATANLLREVAAELGEVA